MGRTANYVFDLVDSLLGPGEREKRFEWALGDPSPKTKRRACLPFDAVWEARKLIVEVDEDQHREATPHFDKPSVLTVSGVHRGEQRRQYDQRKRTAATAAGYTLIALAWERKRTRRPVEDLAEVRSQLIAAGLSLSEETTVPNG